LSQNHWGRNVKIFLSHIFAKNISIHVKSRPGRPRFHAGRFVQYSAAAKIHILLEIFGRQCARRSVTVCRSRRIAFCALIRDRPPCCLLFSRQLWAPVRQTMHQSSNRMAAVNRSFALPSTGRPYGTIYGSGVSLSDSSPAGFKRTLKTHLFTLEQCRPSTGTAVTLQ